MARIRRTPLLVAAAVGLLPCALALIGAAPLARAGGMPTVSIEHDGGVTVVEPDNDSRVVLRERNAIASASGAAVATVRWSNGRSIIKVRKGASGDVLWEQSAAGSWRPEAISADGRRVALGDPAISNHHAAVPHGRASTPLVLLTEGEAPRPLTLRGNFVAEAFSTDGTVLVLVEHLPAVDPTSYRVRPLEVRTARLLAPTGGRKGAELEDTVMRGARVNQAWAPGGRALYTLYETTTKSGRSAFVHALNLDNVRAACLNVPPEIDAGYGRGTVAWVDETTVAVIGRAGVATIDTRSGLVRRLSVSGFRRGQPVAAALAGTLWIGHDATLEEVELSSLRVLRTSPLPAAVIGLVPLSYGPVAVLDEHHVLWFAAASVRDPIWRGVVQPRITGAVTLRFLQSDPVR